MARTTKDAFEIQPKIGGVLWSDFHLPTLNVNISNEMIETKKKTIKIGKFRTLNLNYGHPMQQLNLNVKVILETKITI